MSDDFKNLFDDDSLLPAWLQDSMGSPPEETSPDEVDQAAPGPRQPASSRPPWDQMRGAVPPPPAGRPAVPPPWEAYRGQPPAPPAGPAAVPFWESGPPEALPGDFVDWSGAGAAPPAGQDAGFDAVDWTAPEESRAPSSPAGEIPRGLTGALPWMSDRQPADLGGMEMPSELADLGAFDFDALETEDQGAADLGAADFAPTADPYGGRSMAERAGLRDEAFTFDSLVDEFESSGPDEAPPAPLPSLRDRLQSLVPEPGDEAWMAAFGEAAAYDMNAPDEGEDTAWLEDTGPEAPAVEPPPSPIRRLAPAPPPAPPPDSGIELDEDLEALFRAADYSAMPATKDEPEPEPPPSPIRRLAATPPPAQEPPPSPIRRLAPTPPPVPPDETPGDESLPSWLRQADDIPDEAAPDTGGLTYEEWERREIERALEEAKTPEDRLVEQVPEWFAKDETPDAVPLPDEFAAPAPGGEGPESQGPEFVPGWFLGLEESDAEAEDAPDWFKNLDYSVDPLAAPPETPKPPPPPAESPPELPDWFKGSTDELPDIDWDKTFGAAAPEEPPPPADEAPLPEPDLEALFGAEETVPGSVPDWLAGAAPVEAGGALPEPDLEALFAGEAEPGSVPDWLAGAAPGEEMIARAEDVPFPDLDLDQVMPGGEDEVESWMTGFEPDSRPGALPLPRREDESAEDFVERFDPLAPEEFSGVPVPGEDDMPDWLREMASGDEAGVGEDEALPLPDDVLGRTEPGRADELDWLRDLSAEDLAETPEFPPPERPIPASDEGMIGEEALDSRAIDQLLGLHEPESAEAPAGLAPEPPVSAEYDWAPGDWEPTSPAEEAGESGPPFGEIYGVPTEPEEGAAREDLAALLAGSDAADVLPGVEDLFPVQADYPPPASEEPPAPAAEPSQLGWVSELRPTDLPVAVKAGGAEISVRQRQVAELPDRLRALHTLAAQALQAGAETPPAPESGVLQGLTGLLPAAELAMAHEVMPVEGLIVTPEQQVRLNRLQAMLDQVAAEEEEVQEQRAVVQGAEEFTYGEGAEAEAAAVPRRARRRIRYKPDRLLIAVLVLAALIAPFITDALHFAGDPPVLGGARQGVAGAVDALAPGDYVLFAFEYGPTAAGELDALAEAVLRDVLAHRAIPLTISTNPVGAFHAQAVLDPLRDDPKLLEARGQGETALSAGEDYVTLSYLPGEAVGVRTLRSRKVDADGKLQVLPAFQRDLRGGESGLAVGDLSTDIALIVVIGEESGAVRTWAEQLSDVPVPKIALVTAAIEPLAAPYADGKGYAGYLAGVRDTYSYNQQRNAASRAPYTLPDGVPDSIPDPEQARWHSMALGAAAAAGLIGLGTVINVLRALGRRRRR